MNIRRRLGENRRNFPRTPGAVRRIPRDPNQASAMTRPAIHVKKSLILGVGLLVLLAGAGILLSRFKPPPPAELPWQSCLTQWPDGTLYPDLIPVPTGDYQLSDTFQEHKAFLAPHGLHKIAIREPFLIEQREVTSKAFRHYVEFVNRMPDGASKERLQSHIGIHWNKEESDNGPVKGVSWEAAWDYADWLGQQTGCAYTLPSREQWGATVLMLDAQRKQSGDSPENETLKRLLWGVREWTSTPCAGGYYLVGEDDLVPLPEVRAATCLPSMLSVAGFRVAIRTALSGGQEAKTSEPPQKPPRP
ncbi:MAG: SUMF1/EgtB/PvdO family nonheme iron enzyme [Magnetococcales bacterium]|nr:SUMF1/EgtB/PvdO family nonheme iron enzyme [Magnetococcales bacterium]